MKRSAEEKAQRRAERDARREAQGRAPRKSLEERRANRSAKTARTRRTTRRDPEPQARENSRSGRVPDISVSTTDFSAGKDIKFSLRAPLPDSVKYLGEQRREIARKIRAVVETSTQKGKEEFRSITASAFKSRKLPTTWRSKVYPEDPKVATLTPAGLIYSVADDIISSHANGAVIRPGGGKRFLAIPTAAVPTTTGGRKQSFADTAREFGPFRYAQGRNGSLVVIGQVRSVDKKSSGWRERRRTRKFAKDSTRGTATSGPAQSVVFFVLVRQVTLRRRLDLPAAVARITTEFEASMAAALA